jgi:NAD(P)-dependent dehydrogenase (short-subunit alcohol dehydrogenase family)
MASKSEGVVLITGASTGIGRTTALQLAEAGYEVFAGVRRKAAGDSLRKEAKGMRGRINAVTLDVTKPRTLATAKAAVQRRAGRRGLAGLVNNAGIAVGGPLEFIPLDNFRNQIEVNLTGQLAVIQEFLPLLRKGKGTIVNIASIGGRVALPINGPYNASKFALEALSDSLRLELQPWGIKVAVIEPGSVDTEIWRRGIDAAKKLRSEGMPPQAEKLYGKTMDAIQKASEESAERAIPPEKVAKAIVHAIKSPRPKQRYLVGRDAKAMVGAKRALSAKRWDKVVTSQTGVAKRDSAVK